MASVPKETSYETTLLAFTPLIEERGLTSAEHCCLIQEPLSINGRDIHNVEAFICDNCKLKSISDSVTRPMIGCASHRFSLAVIEFVADKMVVFNKVQALMIKLHTLKSSAELRQRTHLKPVVFCVTRWSSMADMLNRYIELKPCLDEHFGGNNHLIEYLRSLVEKAIIEKLVQDMSILLSVSKALQTENIDLLSVRASIDESCRK